MFSSVFYIVVSILIAFIVPNMASKTTTSRISKAIDHYFENKNTDIIKP